MCICVLEFCSVSSHSVQNKMNFCLELSTENGFLPSQCRKDYVQSDMVILRLICIQCDCQLSALNAKSGVYYMSFWAVDPSCVANIFGRIYGN